VIIGYALIAVSILLFGGMTVAVAVEVIPSDETVLFKLWFGSWLMGLTVLASVTLAYCGLEVIQIFVRAGI